MVRTRRERSPLWLASAIVLAHAIVPSARADGSIRYLDCRLTDGTGTNYVVLKHAVSARPTLAPVLINFEIATKRPGSPPVAPASDTVREARPDEVIPNADVGVRDGDLRLGSGQLTVCYPSYVVSGGGLGFAVIDLVEERRGEALNVYSLTIVSREGLILHSMRLSSMLDDELRGQLSRAMGFCFWYDCGWFDQARRKLVIAGPTANADGSSNSKFFRVIDVRSGRVEFGTWDEVAQVLAESTGEGLEQALHLAAQHAMPSAKSDLFRHFSNPRLEESMPLTAAVALGQVNDRRARHS